MNFEELLSNLSAAFVRVSVDEVDNEIERWLERIVLAMGVDRGTVGQIDPKDGLDYISHQWAREGVRAPSRGFKGGHTLLPWSFKKNLAGEAVVFSDTDDLRPEAAVDRVSFRKLEPNPMSCSR